MTHTPLTRRFDPFPHATHTCVRFVSALLLAVILAVPCAAQPAEEDYKDDFSAMGWTQAFDAMHDAMQRKYAFGDWKRIAWPALAARVRPRILAAERLGDATAYYLALRQYSQGIPDPHVGIVSAPDDAIVSAARQAQVGGSYGLTVVQLDGGAIAADYVAAAGPAWRAGIRPGATIIRWNNRPTAQAAAQVDPIWASTPATREVRGLEQLRFLVRDPVGAAVLVEFRNRGAARTLRARLRAEDDAYDTLDRTRLTTRAEAALNEPIAYEMLPGRIGYLRIRILLDRDDHTFVDQLARAMAAFQAAQARALVIDLRGNPGGRDDWAALVGSYIHAARRLYEQVAVYDVRTAALVTVPDMTVYVEPQPIVFERPVVALIDAGTGSSAEGVAMLVQQRPRGTVVGRFATAASFGIAGGEIRMPGALTVKYAMGQSLDADGRIQIDSDRRGRGGIAPEVELAFTRRHLASRQQGRDVELEAALCLLRRP